MEFQGAPHEWVWPDPNGFLLGAILPAWYHGERRVSISGSVCPVLSHQIQAAIRTLRLWYPEIGAPPQIEAQTDVRYPAGNAVSLLSCGIDSMTTLRANKLALPQDHPSAICAVLVISFVSVEAEDFDVSAAKRSAAATRVAAAAGVRLVNVSTNFPDLEDDGYFYSYIGHGAWLASMAQFLSHGIRKTYIGSTDDATCLSAGGSHPLLDPYYSSARVSVEHHGTHMTRLEKTEVVAQWPEGLRNLIVCGRAKRKKDGFDPAQMLNCGTCEKCLRTKLALLVLGKLNDEGAVFFDSKITSHMLNWIDKYRMIYSQYQANCYRELLAPLRQLGKGDLADTLENVLASFVPRKFAWGASEVAQENFQIRSQKPT